MLIDKGITKGEVVTLKLMSGEEIVGKLVEETSTYYKLSKPLTLSMNQQGIGMIPFTFTGNPDKDYIIHTSAVITITNTVKDFADQYIKGTTGLELA